MLSELNVELQNPEDLESSPWSREHPRAIPPLMNRLRAAFEGLRVAIRRAPAAEDISAVPAFIYHDLPPHRGDPPFQASLPVRPFQH